LVDLLKPVLSQSPDHFFRVANGKSSAQGTESSKILARLGNFILEGFSQSASASRAFSPASASVSPALAQPGTSGKTADQRSVNLSFSTTTLNFMVLF
jgi:hypothetical protein